MCGKVSEVQVCQAYTYFEVEAALFSSVLNYFSFTWTCLCSRSSIACAVETSQCFYFTVRAEDRTACLQNDSFLPVRSIP